MYIKIFFTLFLGFLSSKKYYNYEYNYEIILQIDTLFVLITNFRWDKIRQQKNI